MYLYRWAIEKVEGYPKYNNMDNVLALVGWEVEVRDTTDHSIHYIRQETKLNVNNVDPNNFIDYLELDNDIILQWVWNVVGKDTIEQQAKQELDDLRNPAPDQLTSFGMPWKGNCCPDGTEIIPNP